MKKRFPLTALCLALLTTLAFRPLENPGGSNVKVNGLYASAHFSNQVFVLTEKGVFIQSLNDQNVRHAFRGKNLAKKNALAFGVAQDNLEHWYLGTSDGLLETDDAGQTWFRFHRLGRKPISVIQVTPNYLFVASEKSLYRSDDFSHFEKVFTLMDSITADIETVSDETEELSLGIQDIVTDQTTSRIWMATRKGVFESFDNGKTWQGVTQSGLLETNVRHLAYSKKHARLFAGTSKGIFVFKKDRWEKLSLRSRSEDIQGLTLIKGESESLAILSPLEFIQIPLLPDEIKPPRVSRFKHAHLFRKLIQLEPTAVEIQNAAVRYSNLKNSKTKSWQIASRLSALIPNLSFGKDFSRGNNIDLDRGTSSTPDLYIAGPDDVDRGWDFDVSWNLGDFIYSSAQTSIDSREKIMVEYRQEVVSEATRLFYERRRLQMEIVMTPATSEHEHLEKLLRMDELTSLIDGLTGAYLSQKLQTLYQTHPHLNQIWQPAFPQAPESS